MHDVEAAFAAYNEMATEHRLTVCSKLTDALRRQLGKALHDIIGGLDGFKLALSAIPPNDYLMGLKPGKPVVLNLQRLLNQDRPAGRAARQGRRRQGQPDRLGRGRGAAPLCPPDRPIDGEGGGPQGCAPPTRR